MSPAPSPASGPGRLPLLRLLGGSVCISFSPIFIKLAVVPPDVAGFYRMFFSSLALLLWLRLSATAWRMLRRPLLILAGGGVALGIDFMCWHRSIHLLGPGLSTLLGNFQVFFTALFSWLLFGQRLSRLFLGAVLLALTGLLLITGGDLAGLEPGYRHGVLLGLGTALCYSGYILLIKGAMGHAAVNGVSAMLVISLVCMSFMAAVSLVGGASFRIPDSTSLLALTGVGVISTTLGWSLISSAMREAPATIAGLVLLLQPALSCVWDVLIFRRPTAGHEIIGILLILGAIFLGSMRR